jgi:hypothetical protein
MSYYHKYNFVSPEPLFATVKEEMKSYFDTGAIDDLMFPTYLDKCLRRLGKTTYKITETVLFIDNFQARLPDNFYSVREAWMCAEIPGYPCQSATSFYSQAATETTIQVTPVTIGGVPCVGSNCPPDDCPDCMPELLQAVYKTNQEIARFYKKSYLLKPGNISVTKDCEFNYCEGNFPTQSNPWGSGMDSFDIRDNKFVTNFRKGIVHLIFYSTESDEIGNQLVPDNFRIQEYIEAFIKYKLFETLVNQVNDETFNQLQQKLQYYKQLSDEAYIIAETETRKQTPWEKQRRIKNSLNRHNMYELPTRNFRSRRRR